MATDLLQFARVLGTIIALFCALISVTMTSNHFRVRRYLWAMVVATLAEEFFLMRFSSSSDWYFWMYVAVTIPILVTALLISMRMFQALRKRPRDGRGDERWKWVTAPLAAALIGLLSSPLDSRIKILMAIQGAVLAYAGIQTCAVSLLRHATPYLTLGTLWLAQAILFFLYGAGINFRPHVWESLGDWLPAGLVVTAMLKLSKDFLTGKASYGDI